MNTLKTFIPLLLVTGLFLMLGGCSGKTVKPVDALQYPWPAKPNDPSLEFLGVFATEKNFTEPEPGLLSTGTDNRNPEAKLDKPISSWTLAADKILILERSPAAFKVLDFSTSKIYPLFEEPSRFFEDPVDFALDEVGNFYIADRKQGLILVFDRDLKPVRRIGGGQDLAAIEKIVLNSRERIIYLTDSFANEVVAFNYEGVLLSRFGAGTLLAPHGLAIHENGNIYVADTGNAKIRIFNPKGDWQGDVSIGLGEVLSHIKKPWDVAFDHQGNLHIVDQGLDAFVSITPEGKILFATGSSKWRDNHLFGFNGPADIHIDGEDRILIADTDNHRMIVWQILDEANEYSPREIRFSFKEYLPEEKGGEKRLNRSGRIPTFKVGSAGSAILERVVQEGLEESRNAYKSVLCLGTVRCRQCQSYNNIYATGELVETLLLHSGELVMSGEDGGTAFTEETTVACRKCGEALNLSRRNDDNRVRFCLDPREICASGR